MAVERSYVSILSWPAELDEARRIDALKSSLGIDPFRAKELTRRATPTIAARASHEAAAKARDTLAAIGIGVAIVPGGCILKASDPPRLRLLTGPDEHGNYRAEFHRGEPVSVDPRTVMLLVRAHVRGDARPHAGEALGPHHSHALRAIDRDSGLGKLLVQELLDIHLTSGAHYRLCAEKFAFDCLGSARAATPRENTDALTKKLAAESGAPVAAGFDQARFLAEFVHDFAPHADPRGPVAFSVYSAWLGIVTAASRPPTTPPAPPSTPASQDSA